MSKGADSDLLPKILVDTTPNPVGTLLPIASATKPNLSEHVAPPPESARKPFRPMQQSPNYQVVVVVVVVREGKVSYQPKSQTTRAGRATKVSAQFKE